MKSKLTFEEAFETAETLFSVLKATLPKELKLYEMKALFMLRQFKTNNLKEIKERINKDLYDVPKPILEVKIAKTISSLIKLELITKEKHPKDKRQLLINTTEKGNELIDKVLKDSKQKWKEMTNV